MDMLCRMLQLFPPPLKHCDWASMIRVSVLIKGHSRTESTLTKQDFIQWYTTVRLTMAYLQLWIQPLMALHCMKMLWKIVQQMYVCHCDFLQDWARDTINWQGFYQRVNLYQSGSGINDYYRLVINSQLNWHSSCSSLPHQTQGVQWCLCVGKE